MNPYIVYDTNTFKIVETFPAYGKDITNMLLRYPTTTAWVNITHPKHTETVSKINAANGTNYPVNDGNCFKTIITAYWHRQPYPDLPFKHNEEKPYNLDIQNAIIKVLLDKQYKAMLERLENTLIVWIDKGNFGM